MKTGLYSLLFIIFLCFICNLQGQNSKLDSIFNVYEKAKHDSTRCRLMLKIGDQYKKKHSLDTALQWYRKSYIKAVKVVKKDEIVTTYAAAALSSLGLAEYNFKGNYKKSLEYSNKSIQLCNILVKISTNKENLKNIKKILFSSFNNIGIIYGDQGDYNKAVEYYLKSLEIIKELGDNKGMSACYTNIGNVHFCQGNYDSAIKYYLSHWESKNNLATMTELHNVIIT